MARAGGRLRADASRSWIQAVAVQQLFRGPARGGEGAATTSSAARRLDADDAAVYRRVMAQACGVAVTADDAARSAAGRGGDRSAQHGLPPGLASGQWQHPRAAGTTALRPDLSWRKRGSAGTWLRAGCSLRSSGVTATALARRMGETGIRTEPFVTRAVAMLAEGAPASPPAAPPPAPATQPTGASAPDGGTSVDGGTSAPASR